MGQLEKNIRENRRELDRIEMPDTGRIWRGIRGDLQQEPPKKNNGWKLSVGRYWQWSIAASICLIIVAGLWWYNGSASAASGQVDLARYYPELAEQKEEYVRMIKQKEAEVNIQNIDPDNFADIFKELEMLDDIHQQTLGDVPKYIDNEQLVRTLIRYYEQKIRILERLSKEVAKQKYHEEKSHERKL